MKSFILAVACIAGLFAFDATASTASAATFRRYRVSNRRANRAYYRGYNRSYYGGYGYGSYAPYRSYGYGYAPYSYNYVSPYGYGSYYPGYYGY